MKTPTETIAVGLRHAVTDGWHAKLVPDFMAPCVAEIDFDIIRSELGLKDEDNLHGFFDLDGTIRKVGEERVDPDAAQHIRGALSAGRLTTASITSNSRNPGTVRFGWQIDPAVRTYTSLDTGCNKPNPAFFRHVQRQRQIEDEPVLVIGDKVTRDILGARRLGGKVVSLLVPRLGETDLRADRIVGRRFDVAAGMLGIAMFEAVNRYESLINML